MQQDILPGRMLTTALITMMVTACGTRGELSFMPDGAVPGTIETVLVSTARAPAAAPALYSNARSPNPQFARFDISVPPKREQGTVTFSKGNKVDPETDFVVTSVERLQDNRAFLSAVNAEVARFLLMDTLRLMARTENDTFFQKVNAVILISPDIEIDVFRKEAEPVIARGVKIYVIVSKDDRALRFSARLRGERSRLGSIKSADELGGLPVTVVDLSAVESPDSLGHFKAGTSPSVVAFVRALHTSGGGAFNQGNQPGLISGNVAVVQQGSNILLKPVGGAAR
ncbi:alpha/beta hydrolase [Mesorhizobium prunaredense]|nr:alpha/beta hydrolase [Mesorhizobium prunaredense]